VKTGVDQNVVTLDISVNDTQMVHVLEDGGRIPSYSDSFFGAQIDCLLLHVEHIIQRALRNMLKDDIDIWDFGDHTHQDGDVRMSEDTLHHDFVLDFLKELICESGVEDFLDGNWCAIKLALVDDTETSLSDFFSKFKILNGNFSNTWDWRKSS